MPSTQQLLVHFINSCCWSCVVVAMILWNLSKIILHRHRVSRIASCQLLTYLFVNEQIFTRIQSICLHTWLISTSNRCTCRWWYAHCPHMAHIILHRSFIRLFERQPNFLSTFLWGLGWCFKKRLYCPLVGKHACQPGFDLVVHNLANIYHCLQTSRDKLLTHPACVCWSCALVSVIA